MRVVAAPEDLDTRAVLGVVHGNVLGVDVRDDVGFAGVLTEGCGAGRLVGI